MVVICGRELVLYVLVIIVVPMIDNIYGHKYDDFQELSDKEFYNPNEISETPLSDSAIDPKSSMKQINAELPKSDRNFYSDIYPDSVELRRKSAGVKNEESFEMKYNSNEDLNENNRLSDASGYDSRNGKISIQVDFYKPKKNCKSNIERKLFQNNNEDSQQRYVNNKNKKYFDNDRTNNFITNGSNESVLINQKNFFKNGNKNDNEANGENYLNEFCNDKKHKYHKNQYNDTECKKDSIKTLHATLGRYSGHICSPKPVPACASLDKEDMKNKSKHNNKWEPKDLGILQPVNDRTDLMEFPVKDKNKIYNKKYNFSNKLLHELPQNSIHRTYSREHNRKKNSLEDNYTHKVMDSDKLCLREHKIKTKAHVKNGHEHGLQYDRHNHNMVNFKKKLKGSFHKQKFPKLKQESEYRSNQQQTKFKEIPENINVNGENCKTKYGTKDYFQKDAYSNIKKESKNSAIMPYRSHTQDKIDDAIKESAPSNMVPEFQLHSDIGSDNHYQVTNNNNDDLFLKPKIEMCHDNAFYENMRKTKVDYDDHFPHYPESRLNRANSILMDNEEKLQVPFTNIIYSNYINDVMPLNNTSNNTFIDSDYITDTDGDADVDVGSKNEFKRSSENFINDLINQNEYLTHSKYKINNKSDYNLALLNNQDPELYSDLEMKDEIEDQKKRSLNTDREHMSKSIDDQSKDFTNREEGFDPEASKMNKDISKNINYDYRSRKDNDENVNENNRQSINSKNKESNKQSFDDNFDSKKLALIDTIHKKKVKLSGNKDTGYINKNKDNSRKLSFSEEKYKCKKKPEKMNQHIKKEESYLISTTLSHKKYTDNGNSKCKDNTSERPPEKQCHPQAGPPKFKWCSDEMNAVKDQEYEDALKGKIALRIVEVILAKVHKSSKMSYDFGFCRSQKKTGNEDDNTCEAENSILKSQDLKEIMASMEKLSCKSCNQLPPKLKEFLEWLIKVKSVRSVHIKENPFGKHSNCSIGDSAFLFHQYSRPISIDNQVINDNNKGQVEYYNSPFEPVRNCEYDQINKLQPKTDINNEAEHDFNLLGAAAHAEQNDAILEQQNELYNRKLKRYANEREFNYADNSNLMTNAKLQPYLRSGLEPKDVYSNIYKNLDNSYDYYINNKVKNIDPRNEPKELNSLHKINIDDINAFYSILYNRDKYSKQIPFDYSEYKKDDNYKIDEMKHTFDDLGQVRRKRNHNKLQLQELMSDRQPDLNFGMQFNQPDIKNEMTNIIHQNAESDKIKDIADENDQQLGFYTPVVFRIPDDYEII